MLSYDSSHILLGKTIAIYLVVKYSNNLGGATRAKYIL